MRSEKQSCRRSTPAGAAVAPHSVSRGRRVGTRSLSRGLLILVLVTAAGSVLAADQSLRIPPGWWIDNPSEGLYALVGDTLAIPVVNSDPPIDTSRIVQFRGLSNSQPTVVVTDVPGKVFRMRLSPDGRRLCVQSVGAGEEIDPVTMIDEAGTVLWSKDTALLFDFSTTGEALVATQQSVGWLGPVVSVYSPAGVKQKEMSIVEFAGERAEHSNDDLRGVVLVGDGRELIAATRCHVRRLVFASPPTTVWDVANSKCAPEFVGVRVLDEDRVVAERTDGGFVIIRASDGVVEYSFDPVFLAQLNPQTSRNQWLGYNAYAGSAPDTATLFNGTSAAYTLDIAKGMLTPRTIDASAAQTSVVQKRVDGQRLVVLTWRQVRIRPLAP